MFGFAPYSAATFAGLGSVKQDINMEVTSGTFTLSLQGAAKLISEVTPNGELNLTGQDVTLRKTLKLTADSGSFSINGQAVSFNTSMSAVNGSYATSGQDVFFNVTLPFNNGSFFASGQDVFFKISMKLNCMVLWRRDFSLVGTTMHH